MKWRGILTAFVCFQEHKMASVRDESDMNPLMMDNPVFSTGSSVNLFCPLCHEMFSNPRLLPCLHTFCKRCLENLVVPRSSLLSCPACRTDVSLTVRLRRIVLSSLILHLPPCKCAISKYLMNFLYKENSISRNARQINPVQIKNLEW